VEETGVSKEKHRPGTSHIIKHLIEYISPRAGIFNTTLGMMGVSK